MTDRSPALAPFAALIGTWATEATHPMVDGVVRGKATFDWLEGGRFLVYRSRNEHELFPDSVSVIAASDTGDNLVMAYLDSRPVRRTYGVALDGGVLRIWRDHPEFAQRFKAKLADDEFDGLWQVARSRDDWHDDLAITYRRARSA